MPVHCECFTCGKSFTRKPSEMTRWPNQTRVYCSMHCKRKIRPVIVPIGPSIAYVDLRNSMFALIPSWAAEDVGKNSWSATKGRPGYGFIATAMVLGEDGTRKSCSLHRFLMGKPPTPGHTVDHKEPGDPLNCLPHNLRWAEGWQQQANIRTKPRELPRGVYAPKHISGCRKKYTAKIRVNCKTWNLGYYETPDQASAAYKHAALLKRGEFARWD